MKISYSQFGEDLMIVNVLRLHKRLNTESGAYVDVGAHHPIDHSNTYLLHKDYGFTGYNIDADQDLVNLFDIERPLDTNICAAISDREGDSSNFVVLEQRGMSSLCEKTLKAREGIAVVDTRPVNTKTLTHVLDKSGAPSDIDFLNIDIEGMDLECLKGLDFHRYSPFCICIEDIALDLRAPQKSMIFNFLTEIGYILFSRTWISSQYYHPKLSKRT